MTMPLAVEWTNLHQILRSLYADMLPLCSDMMGIAKGLAGLGALFFIAYRVWKSLAAAEPIEVFPLLRPFVLGLCIMAFPTLVLGPLNGLLSPISNATSHLVDRQAFDLEKYQTQKDELQRQAMLRDPEKAYLISNEEFDKRLDELGWKPKDLMAIAGMYAERAGYQFGQKVREAFRTFLETLFQAASLTIDTVRTFFTVVDGLSVLEHRLAFHSGISMDGDPLLPSDVLIHLIIPARCGESGGVVKGRPGAIGMADLEVSVLPMRAVHMCHLLLKAGHEVAEGRLVICVCGLSLSKAGASACCCIAYQSTPFAACMTVCGASGSL